MFEFLKESFLSIFVVGYRLHHGAWPPSFNADAHKAVAVVTIFETVMALTVFTWVQILFDSRVAPSHIVLWLVAVALYGVNYHFLLTKKVGSDFEKRFNHFPKVRRVSLRIVALVIFFGTFALALISVPYYQHAFHIVPKA